MGEKNTPWWWKQHPLNDSNSLLVKIEHIWAPELHSEQRGDVRFTICVEGLSYDVYFEEKAGFLSSCINLYSPPLQLPLNFHYERILNKQISV